MGQPDDVIVVVEGPSAAGKTTWCRQHATRWLPEPGPWPMDEVSRYQLGRWREAVTADQEGEVIVLDGDPFKLYYSWAQLQLGQISDTDWRDRVRDAGKTFARGDYGLADVVLYADPGVEELTRRKAQDLSRSRRNFERHTAMRPYFRRWYEAVACLDPTRVIWEHPTTGLSNVLIGLGRRASRSGPELLGRLLDQLR